MNERQLHSFILAADTKSFSKAAHLSYVSTPALIQQINLLEENVGFHLFNRTNHGVTLTSAGESFYISAKKILNIFDDACTQGQALEKTGVPSLKIACPLEQFPAFLLTAYEEFHNEYSNATIDFISTSFNNHISAIAEGTADLSVIAQPNEKYLNGLLFSCLCQDTYSFCMRPNHPLAQLSTITLEDLKNTRIIYGDYYYLKVPFEKQLKVSSAQLFHIDKEYDMSVRTERLLSDEIMVIHSLWSAPYKLFLSVVPSNISAGNVGVLYHKTPSFSVQHFLPYLTKACTSIVSSHT